MVVPIEALQLLLGRTSPCRGGWWGVGLVKPMSMCVCVCACFNSDKNEEGIYSGCELDLSGTFRVWPGQACEA